MLLSRKKGRRKKWNIPNIFLGLPIDFGADKAQNERIGPNGAKTLEMEGKGMSRMKTIGAGGPENSVITYRMAVELARGLRQRGWAVSGRLCRGKTPAQVARVLVPVTAAGAREKLAMEICEMAGFMPALGEQP